eukprot:5244845-Pyramimonas_sp.AAC.1
MRAGGDRRAPVAANLERRSAPAFLSDKHRCWHGPDRSPAEAREAQPQAHARPRGNDRTHCHMSAVARSGEV